MVSPLVGGMFSTAAMALAWNSTFALARSERRAWVSEVVMARLLNRQPVPILARNHKRQSARILGVANQRPVAYISEVHDRLVLIVPVFAVKLFGDLAQSHFTFRHHPLLSQRGETSSQFVRVAGGKRREEQSANRANL
jgi:hypothetical protein